MGRIADALKRAEQERRTSAHSVRAAEFDAPADQAVATLTDSPSADALLPREPGAASECPSPSAVHESLIPFLHRGATVTEQYRSLRTRLLSQNPHGEHRLIAVTSAAANEGKSVSTLNLGCVLAEIRHLRIAVVDADLRRGALARLLQQPETPGLTDALCGEVPYARILHKTCVPSLTLVSAGRPVDQTPAELLASSATTPILQRLKNDFHYTIIDTPPAAVVADAGIIAQHCSGVIMVVRLNQTDEVSARRTVRLFQANRIPILGCLVVGRPWGATRVEYGLCGALPTGAPAPMEPVDSYSQRTC